MRLSVTFSLKPRQPGQGGYELQLRVKKKTKTKTKKTFDKTTEHINRFTELSCEYNVRKKLQQDKRIVGLPAGLTKKKQSLKDELSKTRVKPNKQVEESQNILSAW